MYSVHTSIFLLLTDPNTGAIVPMGHVRRAETVLTVSHGDAEHKQWTMLGQYYCY